MEELRELVVTEQLINTLPCDIQIWGREMKPTTSSEAGRLADDYLQAHKPTGASTSSSGDRVDRVPGGDRKCHNCGEIGQELPKAGLGRIRIRW